MDLTIAIPTYNRNNTLLANLERLLPQLTPECRLLIVDNASDVPVEKTLEPLLALHPAARVEIVRNRFNVGSNGNFARCFEHCQTEWIWLLSDDDPVQPDAVATVRRHLAAHPECLYFNFASNFVQREAPILTRGLDGFAEQLDDFGNVLFISVGVYKTAAIQPQLRFGIHYGYTMGGHVALLLASIGETGLCYMSEEELVTWNGVTEWPKMPCGLGIMTLLELPMSDRAFVALRRKIAESMHFLRFSDFGRQCVEIATRTGDRERAQHLLVQLFHRFVRPAGGAAPWLMFWCYQLLIRFPSASARLLSAYRKARGHHWFPLEDRFSRI